MNVLEWSLPIIATKTSKMFLHLLKMMEKGDDNNVSEDQAEVMSKLECLSNMLENKKAVNFQLLFGPSKLETK